MQLYGSVASPYARRLRMFMQNMAYDFKVVDIFNSRDRASLSECNPTLKIPMLKDEEKVILDSRMIYQYIANKLEIPALSWEQENLLTSIDAVNDSLVQLFILSRSEIDVSADKLYFRIQRERADLVFSHLNEHAQSGAFDEWNYLSISLFCLLDWIDFRQVYDVSQYTNLVSLHAQWAELAVSHETDPRK